MECREQELGCRARELGCTGMVWADKVMVWEYKALVLEEGEGAGAYKAPILAAEEVAAFSQLDGAEEAGKHKQPSESA